MHRYRRRYILTEPSDAYWLIRTQLEGTRMKVIRLDGRRIVLRTDNTSLPRVLQILENNGMHIVRVSGTLKSLRSSSLTAPRRKTAGSQGAPRQIG